MLCYRSLILSKYLIHSDWICCVLQHYAVYFLSQMHYKTLILMTLLFLVQLFYTNLSETGR
ncbi:hypothetical protein CUM19_19750 [Escherichia coli]|nr:hypothetical protein [Escherichia coli]MIQ94143.1 hypothetical protein [Salmonella enterica subsp. enterica serovar Enteritidis]EEY0082102.1 hypothetical protein [Escherichia coli]EEY0087650.1 hypothetical protein [Escherichia coli]EEY0092220.1 hypothetical protein [Escherichia coli]